MSGVLYQPCERRHCTHEVGEASKWQFRTDFGMKSVSEAAIHAIQIGNCIPGSVVPEPYLDRQKADGPFTIIATKENS